MEMSCRQQTGLWSGSLKKHLIENVYMGFCLHLGLLKATLRETLGADGGKENNLEGVSEHVTSRAPGTQSLWVSEKQRRTYFRISHWCVRELQPLLSSSHPLLAERLPQAFYYPVLPA